MGLQEKNSAVLHEIVISAEMFSSGTIPRRERRPRERFLRIITFNGEGWGPIRSFIEEQGANTIVAGQEARLDPDRATQAVNSMHKSGWQIASAAVASTLGAKRARIGDKQSKASADKCTSAGVVIGAPKSIGCKRARATAPGTYRRPDTKDVAQCVG